MNGSLFPQSYKLIRFTNNKVQQKCKWTTTLLFTALSLLCGCTILQVANPLPSLPLLAPTALGHEWQVSQTVTLHPRTTTLDNQEKKTSALSFIAAWSVTQHQINFVSLTPMGQVLMNLQYDGKELVEHYSPILNKALPGKEVLIQLQLAHWPLAVINHQFRSTDWRIEEQGLNRKVYLGTKLVLAIYKKPASTDLKRKETLEIINYPMQYLLSIETINQTLLNRVQQP
ncbi:hypothetical protein AB835_07885 [Candidatus Endobugula sertula]|uniref:Outer-membrane lipoprotein LolB n=1 Tax=Candidatus Endobugula sertula TaxID=62101 RepID=A0A1D2QPY9_9GAMM|nr:hypothetical protein AB835_07885 [Candidatus Endobugula sertula]